MTELLTGVGSLIAGASAMGGWYLLRARRANISANTEHKQTEMLVTLWEKAVDRIDELETKYDRCYQQKRGLEAAMLKQGVPHEVIRQGMRLPPKDNGT